MMMRNLLAQHAGWEQVGLWQGVSSISDAYLQFITASFSVYLLPTLACLQTKAEISREILKSLRFVLPAAAVSFTVWPLIGDVLKVGCYVFGYLVIAKASLRFYILTEVSTVYAADRFFLLADPAARRSRRSSGIYGDLYRLLCTLCWRFYYLS